MGGPVKDDFARCGPRLPCCEAARSAAVSGIQSHGPLIVLDSYAEPPVWGMRESRMCRVAVHPIRFCPFCGKPVPEVERDPDRDDTTCDLNDTGRCLSCGKRGWNCECDWAAAEWRVKA